MNLDLLKPWKWFKQPENNTRIPVEVTKPKRLEATQTEPVMSSNHLVPIHHGRYRPVGRLAFSVCWGRVTAPWCKRYLLVGRI